MDKYIQLDFLVPTLVLHSEGEFVSSGTDSIKKDVTDLHFIDISYRKLQRDVCWE